MQNSNTINYKAQIQDTHMGQNQNGYSPVTLHMQWNPSLLFFLYYCSNNFNRINEWCRWHWTSSGDNVTGEDPCSDRTLIII
jgi:hypothetical protein